MTEYTSQRLTSENAGQAAKELSLLSADLAETAGYASPPVLAALFKRPIKEYVQAIERDGHILVSATVKGGLFLDRSWITPLMSTGRPAFSRKADAESFRAFAGSLRRPLLIREIETKSAGYHFLSQTCGHLQILAQWQRACLDVTGTFENWLAENFDHKRRKELKRLRARLGELGDLRSESVVENLDSFIDDFLELEAGGWKGKSGSALRQDADMTAALREGLAALHRAGKLRFWRLVLDGKAIASLFAIVECGRATLGKIAYDEQFSKYSPGVLVILDATAALFADPAVTLADSNAVPDHPMINRLWRDRIDIADIVVAGDHVSVGWFTTVVFVERLRLSLRSKLKYMYRKLKGQ